VGAGAAGLAAARELRAEGHLAVVFEKSASVGGVWVGIGRAHALFAAQLICTRSRHPGSVVLSHSSFWTPMVPVYDARTAILLYNSMVEHLDGGTRTSGASANRVTFEANAIIEALF